MKIKGVIFDFDGVVVDSLAVHLEAWAKATLEVFKMPLANPQRFSGHSTHTIAGIIAKELGDRSRASTLAMIKRQHLAANHAPLPLLPGVREAFAALEASRIPFGIASNAPRQFIIDSLTSLNLRVSTIVGLDDVRRGKPDPESFNSCARLLKLDKAAKAATLILEDSMHGLKAAVASGMIPIGITSQHSAAELLQAGATLTCATPAEALAAGWFAQLPLF